MKKASLVMKSILGLGVVMAMGLPLLAEAPLYINYQGKLTGASGVPVEGSPIDVIFKFYDMASGGSLLFTAPSVSVTPQNGVFSCLIDLRTKPDLFTSNQAVYLGVKVGTASEFPQRQRLVAAPYALSVGANSVGTAEIKLNSITNEKVATGLDAGKITVGRLGDDRLSETVTKLGNTVNSAGGLLQLNSSGKVPASLWNNSIVNENINDNAAIGYGKLDLSGSIVKDDFNAAALTTIYLTGDGRLIQGKVYKTAMCGVSAGSPLYYSCNSQNCDQPAPVANCESTTLVGNLIQ
ncbi:MAG: hypothetical protein JNK54_06220 [Elusimicrobia bacterium]|nr:hypothetical protein [Elusimicrobiota bacterium]